MLKDLTSEDSEMRFTYTILCSLHASNGVQTVEATLCVVLEGKPVGVGGLA